MRARMTPTPMSRCGVYGPVSSFTIRPPYRAPSLSLATRGHQRIGHRYRLRLDYGRGSGLEEHRLHVTRSRTPRSCPSTPGASGQTPRGRRSGPRQPLGVDSLAPRRPRALLRFPNLRRPGARARESHRVRCACAGRPAADAALAPLARRARPVEGRAQGAPGRAPNGTDDGLRLPLRPRLQPVASAGRATRPVDHGGLRASGAHRRLPRPLAQRAWHPHRQLGGCRAAPVRAGVEPPPSLRPEWEVPQRGGPEASHDLRDGCRRSRDELQRRTHQRGPLHRGLRVGRRR